MKGLNDPKRKECLVTIEDLKEVWNTQKGKCAYTNIELSLPTYSNRNPEISYKMASIDRIDSSKPYTKDNIQFVSRNINYAKHSLSHEEMLEFLKLIK